MTGERIDGLTGLRAVACLMVISFHALATFRLTTFGFAGVPVFFLLSAYLLLGKLQRDNTGSLKRYFARRVKRLWLGYLSAVVATFFFLPKTYGQQNLGILLSRLDFTEVWFSYHSNVFWSVQVEEVAYVLFPVVALLAIRSRKALGPVLIVLGFATSFLPFQDTSVSWIVPLGIMGYGVGVLCLNTAIPRRLSWLALAILFVSFSEPLPEMSALALIALLGFGATVQNPPGFLAARPLVSVGNVSYSLYLWHLFFILTFGLWSLILVFPFAYVFENLTNLNNGWLART